jgi:hypothetical protein
MFGWFRATCTIDPVTREWIENRWRWLTDQFGSELMISAPTILPTEEFFPDPYDASEAAARVMFDRVCGYMGTDAESVKLEFYSNNRQFSITNESGRDVGVPGGTYHNSESGFVVRLDRAKLDQPMALVATMAHELAHVRLLGEDRIQSSQWDNELLTDLTAIFHGMGIFRANHPAYWHEHTSNWPNTDIPRPEYMTGSMLGYTLAYRNWLREELIVKWQRHLKPASRAEFKQATRFLLELDKKRDQNAK